MAASALANKIYEMDTYSHGMNAQEGGSRVSDNEHERKYGVSRLVKYAHSFANARLVQFSTQGEWFDAGCKRECRSAAIVLVVAGHVTDCASRLVRKILDEMGGVLSRGVWREAHFSARQPCSP